MVVIFSIVQLETSFIFFSASDKSLAQWHTPKNLHRNRGPGKPVGIMVNPVVEFLFFKDQNGQRCISCLLVLKVGKFRKQKYLFSILPKKVTYRISANSFRGKYSCLNLALSTVTFYHST